MIFKKPGEKFKNLHQEWPLLISCESGFRKNHR